MAFKSFKQKKFKGISQYINKHGECTALYMSYRDADSKPIKTKAHSIDPTEAAKELADIKHAISREKDDIGKDAKKLQRAAALKRLTLDQAADLYFESRRTIENVKDKQNYLKRISPTLGKLSMKKITSDDILKLQDVLKAKYAPKTTNETLNSLRAMFNAAISKGWATVNPVLDIKKLTDDKEDGKVLTVGERDLMFKLLEEGDSDLEIAPNPTLYFFCTLLYYTGARPTAIKDLRRKDIDVQNGTIRIKAMKKGKSYKQKINPAVMETVAEWIENHHLKHDDCLFYSQQSYRRSGYDETLKATPMNMSSFSKPAQKFFDKVFNEGIPTSDTMHRISLYSLRRTSGTDVYGKHGLVAAMKFLNHTTVTTTMVYLNVNDDPFNGGDYAL